MNLKKRLLPLVLAVLALLPAAGLFVVLETYAAYRSPLIADQPAWTPRDKGRADYDQWVLAKQEAERQRAELMRTLDTEKMVLLGQEIVSGKGLCFNCHKVGESGSGTKGPNLQGVGERAGSRVEGMTDVEYLAQSLYQPKAYIVEGYFGSMIPADEPPVGLDELEIKMVVAYLQTLGGEATVGPDTKLPFADDQ